MLLIIYKKISNKHYLKNNRTHSFRKSLSNTTKNLKSRECTKKSNPSECNFKNSGSLQRIQRNTELNLLNNQNRTNAKKVHT